MQYQTSQPRKVGKGCPAYCLEMSEWVGSAAVRELDGEFAMLLYFLIHGGQTWGRRIVAEDHKWPRTQADHIQTGGNLQSLTFKK